MEILIGSESYSHWRIDISILFHGWGFRLSYLVSDIGWKVILQFGRKTINFLQTKKKESE